MSKPLGCIVCKSELESAITDNDDLTIGDEGWVNQPHDANVFTTSGAYGATFFDPMSSGVELLVNICTRCLRAAQEEKLIGVMHTVVVHQRTFKLKKENDEQ